MAILDTLTVGHSRMNMTDDPLVRDIQNWHRKQKLAEQQRARETWSAGGNPVRREQMTRALATIARQSGQPYYPKNLEPENLPKKVFKQLFAQGFKPGSLADREWAAMHTVEVTSDFNNSAEAQAAIFSGGGVEHTSGSSRYGYSTGYDSNDKAASFDNLTEEIARKIACAASKPVLTRIKKAFRR